MYAVITCWTYCASQLRRRRGRAASRRSGRRPPMSPDRDVPVDRQADEERLRVRRDRRRRSSPAIARATWRLYGFRYGTSRRTTCVVVDLAQLVVVPAVDAALQARPRAQRPGSASSSRRRLRRPRCPSLGSPPPSPARLRPSPIWRRAPLPGRAVRGRRSAGRGRRCAAARRGVPRSTISPSWRTRIWSAIFTVRSRWAMTNVVRPSISFASACWIRYSVCVSTLDVESSRIRMRGSSSSVRAIAMRCFWPPESVMPRSPTHVS